MELTKRQKDILYAIITEFIETAFPVGSNSISDKYEINASPATIRYEMVKLADDGYISKSHSSAGRVPTLLGYRLYLRDLMSEEEVDYLTEMQLKRKLADLRYNRDQLIRGITSLLADLTKYASILITENGIYYSGLYHLLDYPEFEDRNAFKDILLAFDDISTINGVFRREFTDERVKVIIGDELEEKILQNCSLVFTEVNLFAGERAILGIIGPKRMRFSKVIPLIRTSRQIVNTLLVGWE
jgi:heat-inducible transcriptional repressor